jgi:hypothetical protein
MSAKKYNFVLMDSHIGYNSKLDNVLKGIS